MWKTGGKGEKLSGVRSGKWGGQDRCYLAWPVLLLLPCYTAKPGPFLATFAAMHSLAFAKEIKQHEIEKLRLQKPDHISTLILKCRNVVWLLKQYPGQKQQYQHYSSLLVGQFIASAMLDNHTENEKGARLKW